MEDLSDILKRNFCGLYKKKGDAFIGAVKERVVKMNEQRKINRHDVVHEKRKIPVDMSPVVTPLAKREKSPLKKETVKEQKQESVPNKRLEMLYKWKADKEKRRQMQKNTSKPIFKVSHVPVNIGLPNLENVNKEIKGKPIKSKFAPSNHKFRPPANIKPIDFNHVAIDTQKKESNKKEKTDLSKTTHKMVTRSQSRSNSTLSTAEKKTNSQKSKVATTKTKQPKIKEIKDGDKKEDRGRLLSQSSTETTDIQSDSTSLISSDYPVDRDKDSNGNEDTKTPEKTEPPPYVSPFVTISRGKDSARKEYEARKLRQSFNTKSGSLDCTSPKAGAAYFKWLLDNQTKRLQQVCAHWTTYKEENDPPEEATSMIDVAIGQTNLLLTKKFVQFRGLIHNCQNADGETTVTCEDLHGFWDMMHIQVDNLDKRFENLEKLRTNNWVEIVPEMKKEVVKKRGRPVKNVQASSKLREAIKAARRKKQLGNDEIELNGVNNEPQKSVEKKTPKRKSSRIAIVKSDQKNHRDTSPGLMMMKVAQYAKNVETPAKSILKSDAVKSAKKSHSKTVLFQDEVNLDADDIENDSNSTNRQSKTKTPQRRSLRLSKNKLF